MPEPTLLEEIPGPQKARRSRSQRAVVVMFAVAGFAWAIGFMSVYDSLGPPEWLVLALLAVLLFGRRLVDIGYWFGQRIISQA